MTTPTAPTGALALALSSSTGVMSAAVGRVGEADALAAVTTITDRRHAEEISPLVQKLLADSGVTLGELELLIVDRGPGRFTGLRVGLATIKTLGFALGVPVVGLTSLEILAAVARSRSIVGVEAAVPQAAAPIITAVIDARRNEVFQQRFNADLHPADPPAVGPAAALAAEAGGIVIGDGLDRYRSDYEAAAVAGAELVAGIDVDAAVMLAVAADQVTVSGSKIEPLYLRDPDVNPNVKVRPRV